MIDWLINVHFGRTYSAIACHERTLGSPWVSVALRTRSSWKKFRPCFQAHRPTPLCCESVTSWPHPGITSDFTFILICLTHHAISANLHNINSYCTHLCTVPFPWQPVTLSHLRISHAWQPQAHQSRYFHLRIFGQPVCSWSLMWSWHCSVATAPTFPSLASPPIASRPGIDW